MLDPHHQPLWSHTLKFGFENKALEPPNESFLDIQAANIAGQLLPEDKEMLAAALRFYFGPAQFKHLQTLAGDKDLNEIDRHSKLGKENETLEQQTGSTRTHPAADQVQLDAARHTQTDDKNPHRLPSYSLKARQNHSFYVGPDFGGAGFPVKVINANNVYPLKFSSMDFGQRASGEPPNFDSGDGIGDQLEGDEKKMLEGVLQFFFEPAKRLSAVARDPYDFRPMQFYFQSDQWAWWKEVLKNLGFQHLTHGQLKLTKRDNPQGKPSYFLCKAEAGRKLMMYVGRGIQHGRSGLSVINILELGSEDVPQTSHTLDFGFLEGGARQVSKGLDGSFLENLKPQAILVGSQNIYDDDKKMLLNALRFYFGPANTFWDAVTQDPLEPEHLKNASAHLRRPGQRYDILEKLPGLGRGYFSKPHQVPEHVQLYAARDTTPPHDKEYEFKRYFLYEAKNNLTFYIGPDFFHGRPTVKVINTFVLDDRYMVESSHTFDFGFEEFKE